MITKVLAPALLAAVSVLVVASYAEAADGGTLSNTSCEVSSGGGSADNIPVDLGRVSVADIGNRTEPRVGTAKDIDLFVICSQPAAENSVHMSPWLSQVDADDFLLPR